MTSRRSLPTRPLRREAEGVPVEAPYTIGDIVADHVGVLDHFGIARAPHLRCFHGRHDRADHGHLHAPSGVITMTSVMSSSGNPELPSSAPEVQRLLLASPEDPDDRDSVIAFTLACDRVWGSPRYPFDESGKSGSRRPGVRTAATPPSGVLRPVSRRAP